MSSKTYLFGMDRGTLLPGIAFLSTMIKITLEGFWPKRLLDFKWGFTKYNLSKLIGVFQQREAFNVNGSNMKVFWRQTLELYSIKSKKNVEFTYQHCWLMV